MTGVPGTTGVKMVGNARQLADDPLTARPLIGVLGGLGPAATLDFYAKVLALTPAASDQEHVRLLIDADPEVPNRNESVAGSGPSSAPALVAKAMRLKAAGAELLVMPCNAAHAYLADIATATGLRLISIVDEALKAARSASTGARRIGLLATTGTLQAGLYQRAMEAEGLEAATLGAASLASFMDVIYRVKAGELQGGNDAEGAAGGQQLRGRLLALAAELIDDGAEVLIAACTEVPLVITGEAAVQLSVPLIDATQVLARAVVDVGAARRIAAP